MGGGGGDDSMGERERRRARAPSVVFFFLFFFRDQIRKGKNLCSPTKPFLWPLRGVDNFLPILEIAIESDRDNLVICLFLISIFSMSWLRVVGGD